MLNSVSRRRARQQTGEFANRDDIVAQDGATMTQRVSTPTTHHTTTPRVSAPWPTASLMTIDQHINCQRPFVLFLLFFFAPSPEETDTTREKIKIIYVGTRSHCSAKAFESQCWTDYTHFKTNRQPQGGSQACCPE